MSDPATSVVDPVLAPSSTESPALEGQVTPDNSQQRISALMSNWQKEQAESGRLREQLTTAITRAEQAEARVKEIEAGGEGKIKEIEDSAKEVSGRVTTLETENTDLRAEVESLRFLRDNPDLIPYAMVLPKSTDRSLLEQAAATVRNARTQEQDRWRTQLTTPSGGSQPPRTPTKPMTSSEVEQYLASADSPAEFDKRIAALEGMKFG